MFWETVLLQSQTHELVSQL